MIPKTHVSLLATALICCGCSYRAEVLETPSFNVASSFGSQIPGLWFLYVDGSALDRPVKTSTMACAAYKFPIIVSGPFTTSVKQTLDNVVDQIEVVSGPVDRSQLQSRHARGIIIVRGGEANFYTLTRKQKIDRTFFTQSH